MFKDKTAVNQKMYSDHPRTCILTTLVCILFGTPSLLPFQFVVFILVEFEAVLWTRYIYVVENSPLYLVSYTFTHVGVENNNDT